MGFTGGRRLHGEVPMHQSLVQFMRISAQGAGALAEARSVWGQAQRAGVLAEEVLMPERLPASSAGRQEEDVGVGQVPERPRHGSTPDSSSKSSGRRSTWSGGDTSRSFHRAELTAPEELDPVEGEATRAWWLTMTP